ncbi:MAG: HAD-IA family hydrolase [Alphaproteobacteria bacterium]|nr:HAD-IA family hydrolase [Alphaproteobacteria bacterium]
MATSPPPLVLFDCDGTLVDSQHAIVHAMGEAFAGVGLAPPAATAVRMVIGLSLREAVLRLLPAGCEREADAATARYKDCFLALRRRPDHDEPLFPGVREAIDAIDRSGALLGIVTGKARRGLLATLERHGLTDRFVTLHTADDGPGKPAPDMVLAAIARIGGRARSTVVVGDTTFDMEMAAAAGAQAIGVAWGYHSPAVLRARGAARIVTAAAELPAAVGRLLAESERGETGL